MVGKYDEMLPKDDVLRLGAGLDLDIYKEAIMALKEQKYLRLCFRFLQSQFYYGRLK